MLCSGFLCVALLVQGAVPGKAPAPPDWPVCPSPVELLPERELFALRKQFRGVWLPVRTERTAPAESQLAFHDRDWLETQLPGLSAPLRAARQPGSRLVLRKTFQLGESRKRAATLHLPGIAGEVRVWLDGQALDLPPRLWAPVEVALPDDWPPGPHVLCLEILAEQEDPVWGEPFISRSERSHLVRLAATSPQATETPVALLTASADQAGPAPLPWLFQLWKVGPAELRPVDEVRSEQGFQGTAVFRARGNWRPDRPESWLVRAALVGKGGTADVRVLGAAPRGYRIEPEGLKAAGRTTPLFVVAARLTPAPELPDLVQTLIVRWRNDRAACVLVEAPVHQALLDAADRLGMLVLLEVPDAHAVAAIEHAWGHHPSLAGFVVPLDTGSVQSSLAVFVRTEAGLVRPGAVTGAGALVVLAATQTDAASTWNPASSAGAAGMVVPASRSATLRTLRQ